MLLPSPPLSPQRHRSLSFSVSSPSGKAGFDPASDAVEADALPLGHMHRGVCWLAGCSMSQEHASVSQGRICSDNCTCCHTEIEVADPTFHLTQSQYTDTRPTSLSTDPILPDAWQGSHWSATFLFTGMTRPGKSRRKRDSNPGSSALEADALTTRLTRLCTEAVRCKGAATADDKIVTTLCDTSHE